MLKKVLQKIRKWWHAKMEFINKVEKYRDEVEGGTRMRGGSFSKMAKEGGEHAHSGGHGRNPHGVEAGDRRKNDRGNS